jgi:hypothetical protein
MDSKAYREANFHVKVPNTWADDRALLRAYRSQRLFCAGARCAPR